MAEPLLDHIEALSLETTKKQNLETVLKNSQNDRHSKSFYALLTRDPGKFLQILVDLGIQRDSVKVLSNVINHNVEEKGQKDALICKILSTIKTTVNSLTDLTPISGYLSLYALISTEYNYITLNHDHLNVFLKFLNPAFQVQNAPELFKSVVSHVLLIIYRNNEANPEETKTEVIDYVDDLVDFGFNSTIVHNKDSYSKFLNLAKVLEALFPIFPDVCIAKYTEEKLKNLILDFGQASIKQLDSGTLDEYSNLVLKEIIVLISSSCTNEQCRTHNYQNYLTFLKLGAQNRKYTEIRILSTYALIKLWSFVQLEKENDQSITIAFLFENLIENFKDPKDSSSDLQACTVEGLAYLSLNTSVRKRFRDDESCIERIVLCLDKATKEKASPDTPLIYALLSIVGNLVALKDVYNSKEEKTKKFLKEYGQPGERHAAKAEDSQDEIRLFNKHLLTEHKIVGTISELKVYKSEQKRNVLVDQLIKIIYMISQTQEKAVRQELVLQGSINVLLNFLIKGSSINKEGETRPLDVSDDELVELRIFALRSLAKLLISVNPELSFKKYDIKTAIPFLVELLGPDISKYAGNLTSQTVSESYLYDKVTNLDKYEALLALTNLSAIESKEGLKKVIIDKSFGKHLDNFIVDFDNLEIQKAAWELVSNLIMEPSLLVKFFNLEQPENAKRLDLLVKLLNANDESLQVTIAGLLANATSEFDMITQILLDSEDVFQRLLTTITDILSGQYASSALVTRVGYILYNLVFLASNTEKESLFRTNSDLKKAISQLMKLLDDRESVSVLVEVIKVARFQ